MSSINKITLITNKINIMTINIYRKDFKEEEIIMEEEIHIRTKDINNRT
jgi:hypothetical protein